MYYFNYLDIPNKTTSMESSVNPHINCYPADNKQPTSVTGYRLSKNTLLVNKQQYKKGNL